MVDIVAPRGYRQRDYLAGWRACEANMVSQGQHIADLEEALEQATSMAEQYGEAIVAISAALNGPNPVLRARMEIVRLDPAASREEQAGP